MKFLATLKDTKNSAMANATVWIAADANRALKTFVWALVGAGAIGWAIGLVVFGWSLWPVSYTGATMHDLAISTQRAYVTAVSDLYAYKGNTFEVRYLLSNWNGDAVACQLAATATSLEEKARLINTAFAINGFGCR